MTKKDYIRFAQLIVNLNNGLIAGDIKDQQAWLTDELCYIFEDDNPRFDEQRFRQTIDEMLNNE